MKDIFRFSERPKFENPSLIVRWRADAGNLGPKVIEYLSRKIKAKSFFEIEPTDFFSFGGVAIEDDTAQFPECRFYSHPSAKDIRKKAGETLRPPDAESWSDLNLLLQI